MGRGSFRRFDFREERVRNFAIGWSGEEGEKKREGKSVGGSFFFRAAEYRLPKIPVITDRRGLVRDGSKSPWRKTAHGPQ